MKEEFLISVAGDTIRVKRSKKNGTWKITKIKYEAAFDDFKQAQKYLNDLKDKQIK